MKKVYDQQYYAMEHDCTSVTELNTGANKEIFKLLKYISCPLLLIFNLFNKL